MLQRSDIKWLIPDRWYHYYGITKESKPSEILKVLKNHGTGLLFVPFINSEPFFDNYIVFRPNIKSYAEWVLTHIFHRLDEINLQTLRVLLRIAAGKLNNIVKRGDCTAEDAFFMHGVLIQNMNQMHFEIHTEELPF